MTEHVPTIIVPLAGGVELHGFAEVMELFTSRA